MMKIDFRAIQHDTLKSLLTTYSIKTAADFEKLGVKRDAFPKASFRRHFAIFSVNEPAEKVWAAYKSITPKDAWAGNLIDFTLLYSRESDSVYYPTDVVFPAAETGQDIFIQLNLAKGLAKILVGHKIVRIDDAKQEIETNYLENSASEGSQILRIVATGPNKTIVEHDSYYSSGSWFRDTVLYPPLHKLVISQFHRNVANYIAAQP
jgi:hypothetical protein